MKRHTRMVDNVAGWIRSQLSLREFAVGDAIYPDDIGARLAVSGSTVRRAIEVLIEEGWVRRRTNGRLLVAALPPEQNQEDSPFVPHKNHVDIVHDAIREKVLRGALKMSESINAKQLAAELGVSLPAVRQVLEAASQLGIVERHPYRGWRTVHLSAADIRDIGRIRLRVEPLAVKYGIRRITDAVIDELAAENEAVCRGEIGDADVQSVDYSFHRTLLDVADHPVLTSTVDPLVQKLFLNDPVRPGHVSCGEHLAILAAIRERNETLAIERLRSHLRASAKSYIAAALRQPRE